MPDLPLDSAMRHHRAGQLRQAEELYRHILAEQPDHAEALHYLGLIALQLGDHEAAIELISRSIVIVPQSPEAQSNLGNALLGAGRTQEAMGAFEQAIALRRDFSEGHYNLGNALAAARRFEDAIPAFAQAVALKFDYPEAHNNLGTALKETGRIDEAVAAFRQAVALHAGYAKAWSNLGVALRQTKELADAIAAFQQAVALRPDFLEAQLHLANALAEAGRVEEAITAFERVLALNPGLSDVRSSFGNLLFGAGRIEDAIVQYSAAAGLRPHDAGVQYNLGQALSHKQDYAAAIEAFRGALRLDPKGSHIHEALGAALLFLSDNSGAEASFRDAVALEPGSARLWNALGAALNCMGKFDEAAGSFRRALDISPDARFYRGLAATGHLAFDKADIASVAGLLDRRDLAADERITAQFVLGKWLDEAGRFDDAFAHFALGNRLLKESRAATGVHFDAAALGREVDEKIATFTPAFFAQRHVWGHSSDLPVFIVGMPRSGTSLVEQIAASHPALFGAGELQTIEHFPLTRMAPESWDSAAIAATAQAWLDHAHSLAGRRVVRITDKMPANIFHLGLIATLFPNARVIFCRRDPRDNCLSCFFQHFDGGNILYSYDLADCARQYVETERLAAHWRQSLPLKMLEVHYEALVEHQEAESRRLIDFLGLPWHPACLNFHKTQRPVMTASYWQVRQPIYAGSVGRWRHYQRHLGTLLAVLGNNS